jgi:hypothetical protein
MKEGSTGGTSLCEGFHEGDLGGGGAPLVRNPKKEVFEICKTPCKRTSLSTGALLGNREGVRLPGLLREKKSISGFVSWTWWSLRF